jgi:acetylornithine deacetylase/succinyl-diaminopimelate desuccinylase family protein
MDVVPAGEGWKTDPFNPVIKNGKIFGRGSLDNKGMFATSYAAIKVFLKKHSKFKGTIFLLAVADEEVGSELGMKWLLDEGFKVDFAIIPDSGLLNKAIIGEKGLLWLKIISFGKQAHGSTPNLGINAIEKLAKLILRLQRIDFGKSFNPAFTPTTLNIGQIEGGYAPNIVPARATVRIDIRYPLGIKKEDILRKFNKEIKKLKKEDSKSNFKLEIQEVRIPHLVSENSPLCKKLLQAAKELKIPMELTTVGGITVGKEMFFSGTSSIICHYATKKDLAHMANEYVEVKSLVKSAELYALVLEKLIFEA